MNKLMEQAAQMQQRWEMQQEAKTRPRRIGRGGMVKVTANGAGEVLSITISRRRFDPEDPRGSPTSCSRRERGAALPRQPRSRQKAQALMGRWASGTSVFRARQLTHCRGDAAPKGHVRYQVTRRVCTGTRTRLNP